MERGFVHPAGELYRFHHVLVRDVAYRGLPKAERAELHELAATALERRDDVDELVGFHYEQAHRYLIELARKDQHATALATAGGERLGHAGLRAWRRADLSAALNLLGRATTLLPAGHGARAELLCELGLAFRVRGDVEAAEPILEEASRTSTEERVRLRAEMELRAAKSLRNPQLVRIALETAEQAIPVLEAAGDDRALGRAWLIVGTIKSNYLCENAAGAEACVRAAQHYRRAGWSPSTSLASLGSSLFCGPTPVGDALELCAQLLVEHEGDRASEANILVWQGALEAMRCQFGLARDAVVRAKDLYEGLGLTLAAVETCGLVLGVVEMLEGKPEAAEIVLREGCAVCEEHEMWAALSNRASELADALYVQNRSPEAEEWAEVGRKHAADDDLSAQAAWRSVAAKLMARTGARDAEEVAREAVDMTSSTDALNERARSLADLAEVLRVTGRDEAAQAPAAEAIDLYEQKGNVAAVALLRASEARRAPIGALRTD
jgi:hypothetical protein